MEDDHKGRRRKALAAIQRSARVARSRGVAVVPLRESREHLMAMFDDPWELAAVIAAYDHIDDVIVFNPDHRAWADMVCYLSEKGRYFSTPHPHHIIRHELGQSAHRRSLAAFPRHRSRIWYTENLGPAHLRIAEGVSGRAMWNPKEFVAEVYAGLWAGVIYDDDVMALFDHFKGIQP
jgi:hypothetical protein